MTLEEALALVAGQRLGVLVTLRRNGRPQTSNIVYAVRDRQIRVSVTEDRAKTRNLRQDPRATLHVSTPDGSAWAALDGNAHLSPVTTTPGDETGRALAALYVGIAGTDHPDWDEYYRAMVDERRLVLTIDVTHGYGGGAR
ncbi:MAG: PPOX class F420-dependent oxidoreductase [Actinomycetota bacterium]|nr:PPOX class F420-dependent oxidoreductase [Actinomycetota bacterium]